MADSHINYVHNKFTSIRTKLPEEIQKMIYFVFVHSQLLYGIEVYANTTPNHLSKLITLNNVNNAFFKINLADHTVLHYTQLITHFQYSYYITFKF